MSDTDRLCLLVLDIDDLDYLEAVFGEDAVAGALEDLGEGFSELGARLLTRHDPLPAAASQYPGRWIAPFYLARTGLREDPDEQREAIAAVARSLARSLFERVFGNASGADVGFRLAVLDSPHGEAADTRFLDGWLDTALVRTPVECGVCDHTAEADLARLIDQRTLEIHLQPILRFPLGLVIGFEALARGPAGGKLECPDVLFGTGERFGRRDELERLCVERALEEAADLPEPFFLSVNAGPDLIAGGDLQATIEALAPFRLRERLIVEITEHLPLNEARTLRGACRRLRDLGVRLALDDTGCGFADVETARLLHPDIVKLCITVVRQAEPGADIIPAIAETTKRCTAMGGEVLAEGIETVEQVAALAGCGIRLAQGFYFGRPRPAAEVMARVGRIPSEPLRYVP